MWKQMADGTIHSLILLVHPLITRIDRFNNLHKCKKVEFVVCVLQDLVEQPGAAQSRSSLYAPYMKQIVSRVSSSYRISPPYKNFHKIGCLHCNLKEEEKLSPQEKFIYFRNVEQSAKKRRRCISLLTLLFLLLLSFVQFSQAQQVQVHKTKIVTKLSIPSLQGPLGPQPNFRKARQWWSSSREEDFQCLLYIPTYLLLLLILNTCYTYTGDCYRKCQRRAFSSSSSASDSSKVPFWYLQCRNSVAALHYRRNATKLVSQQQYGSTLHHSPIVWKLKPNMSLIGVAFRHQVAVVKRLFRMGQESSWLQLRKREGGEEAFGNSRSNLCAGPIQQQSERSSKKGERGIISPLG